MRPSLSLSLRPLSGNLILRPGRQIRRRGNRADPSLALRLDVPIRAGKKSPSCKKRFTIA